MDLGSTALMFSILVLVIVLLALWHIYEEEQWRKERAQLLSRIMARDYSDFMAHGPATPVVPTRILSDEDEWKLSGGPERDAAIAAANS